MFSPISDLVIETSEELPRATLKKVPRLVSLEHRLRRAKNTSGQPISLRDELLFFLEDPPPGTGDRWQKGADLCESHGIKTSRMAVWRFYRTHILEWRREQIPAQPVDPQETARLLEQARHLGVQRTFEMLSDPGLSPSHLIGFLQVDSHRQKLQLARDQFADRLAVRERDETRERFKRSEERARDKFLIPAQMKIFQNIIESLASVPPDTTS